MAKFHINPTTGQAASCSASVKACPHGGADVHFDSADEARGAFEARMADAMVPTPVKAKPEEYARDFATIRTTARTEDIAEAVEHVAINLSNHNRQWGWNAVMGADTRRTKNNIEKHSSIVKAEVGRDPQLRSTVLDHANMLAAKRAYGRAFRAGVAIDPVADEKFERIWAGKDAGHSEEELRTGLARVQEMRRDLKAGKISGTYVVGSGLRNPKRAAEEYLEKREAEYVDAIETRGRSYDVNVANMQFAMRQAGLAI